MDRLLSEEKIKQIRLLPKNENNTYSEMMTTIAAAQLSKTDKEWVEWVVANAEVEGEDIILPGKLWRERRKDIGL